MSNDRTSAVYSKNYFRQDDVSARARVSLGPQVRYGGVEVEAGEFVHEDGVLTGGMFVSFMMRFIALIDVFIVFGGCLAVVAVTCVVVWHTWRDVVEASRQFGLKWAGVAFVRAVLAFVNMSVLALYDSFSAIVQVRFSLDVVWKFVLARLQALFVTWLLGGGTAEAVSVNLRQRKYVVLGTVVAAFVSVVASGESRGFVQFAVFVIAEFRLCKDHSAMYVLAFATFLLRPFIVLVIAFGILLLDWNGPTWFEAVQKDWSKRGLSQDKRVSVNFKSAGIVERPDKRSRDLVKDIAHATGMSCARMFAFATREEWLKFGVKGEIDLMSSKVREVALLGDREMSSILARVALRDGWDVEKASRASQVLLTNAAFAKYFDVHLAKVFPLMVGASEKRKGTLVEALVGTACVDEFYYASVEQFITVRVARVVGYNL